MLFIEQDPDLARQKAAVQIALAEKACAGSLPGQVAERAFAPVADAAARRLHAPATQTVATIAQLVEDFRNDAINCIESPFCNLPPRAEKILASGSCRLRR